MFTQLSDLRKALTFYAIVFMLVVAVSVGPLVGQTMLLVAMTMPTVAVLLMLLVITKDGYSRAGWASLGLHRAGARAWPLAVGAPLAVLGIAHAFVWNTGVATFTPPVGLDAMGWVVGLAPGMFSNLVVVTLTFSLGEELGWRGYLLPKLAATLGPRRGMALTGLLHGLFHMPIIFLTPYYHPDGNRWVFVPLFLAALTVGGLLYGYLRLSTNSVWPASLAHSAHNYFWALFGSFTVASSPLAAEYLAGESGILPIIGYGAVAAWLLYQKSLVSPVALYRWVWQSRAQPDKQSERKIMRSLRGLLGAATFLLVLPVAVLNSVLFGIEAQVTVHFLAAVGFALLALAVFDFRTPRWMTWVACLAASVSAVTYLLQGVSNLVPNDALYSLAFALLGQQPERVFTDVLMLWFLALALTDSHGKTKVLGVSIMSVVIGVVIVEVLSTLFPVLGGSIYVLSPALKLVLLLPFVWLPFESVKQISRDAGKSAILRPFTAST